MFSIRTAQNSVFVILCTVVSCSRENKCGTDNFKLVAMLELHLIYVNELCRDEVQKDSSHDEVRRDSSQLCSISGKVNDSKEFQRQEVASAHHDKLNAANLNGIRGPILVIESDDEIPGPETPGMKPSVSRLKRSQEDFLEDASGRCFQETTKRVKLLQDSINSNKIHNEVSDATSKFEWLNPSQVRDANGRRPGHPLYDKKTLYIPPDVLKKMSASQKQYWNVKCQYMDVLLFFKVVSLHSSTASLHELAPEFNICLQTSASK